MRSIGIFVVSLLAVALLAGPAGASDDDGDAQDDEFSREGWYAGAYGFYAMDVYRNTGGKDYDGSGGMNLRVGYRGRWWAALEGGFEWVDDFETGSGRAKARTLIGGVNARFYPLRGRFQPYGLVGVNGMNVKTQESGSDDEEETDWGFRGGLGLDVYATRHIVVGVEATYVWGVGGVWNKDYATFGAGLLYRF